MFHGLLDVVSSSPWTYAGILAIAAIDAVFPLVPSEATVISAGVLAAAGDLSIAFVVAAAAAGALAGDNGAYAIGRVLPLRVPGRDRIDRLLARRGGSVILLARFVPGGRTAVTVGAGAVGMPFARFVGFAGAAALVWASYAGLVGYAGGSTFEDQPAAAFAMAFGVAGAVFIAIELVRRHRTSVITDSTR